MEIEAKLMEKIKRFEDIKNQIADISKRIGGLTEQQRALYNQGLELKGAIDALLEAKQDADKALAASNTAKLILPEGVKPILPETPAPSVTVDSAETQVHDAPQAAPVVEAPAAPVEEPKAAIPLEVQ